MGSLISSLDRWVAEHENNVAKWKSEGNNGTINFGGILLTFQAPSGDVM